MGPLDKRRNFCRIDIRKDDMCAQSCAKQYGVSLPASHIQNNIVPGDLKAGKQFSGFHPVPSAPDGVREPADPWIDISFLGRGASASFLRS